MQLIARRIMLAEDSGSMFFADFKAGYDAWLFLLSQDQADPSEAFPPPVESFNGALLCAKLDRVVAAWIVARDMADEVTMGGAEDHDRRRQFGRQQGVHVIQAKCQHLQSHAGLVILSCQLLKSMLLGQSITALVVCQSRYANGLQINTPRTSPI